MKNLYHLFVTSYKLHIARFKRFTSHLTPLTSYLKRFTSHLTPHTSHLIPLFAFCFLPFAAFAQNEATVTNVVFSCPGTVTVTYDLVVCGSVDVTLKWSPNKCEWFTATTEEDVQPGNGKTIVWDDLEDASFGKFYYKVEYSYPSPFPDPNPNPTPVLINGVYWSPVNLDFGGVFCENPEDYGALYQWGRLTDGHECRISATTTIRSTTDNPGHNMFILNTTDWRNPGNYALWNSGTLAAPIKTANDPCPDGWRVPTYNELNALTQTAYVDREFINLGINGYVLKNIPDDGNSLFLPSVGSRNYSTGVISGLGMNASYWSSSTFTTSAAYLLESNTYLGTFSILNGGRPSSGYSVRCVLEN